MEGFKPRLPFLKLLWNCLVLNNSEKNTIANFEAGARVVKKEKPPEGLPVSPKDLQTTTPSRHLPNRREPTGGTTSGRL